MGKEKTTNKRLVVIVIAVLVASIGSSMFFYKKYNDLKQSPESVQKKAEVLKNKVAKIISLPDETPVVGTIDDKDKFKDQPFFKDAENGDRILIFNESRKVVLYREKDNRLINVGPIAVTSDSSVTTKSVSVLTDESGNIKGSTNDALVKINGIKVSKSTAKVKVDKLKVYDPGNNDTELAKQISSALGAEVITSIPDGETAPEGADVVVFESLN